MYSTRTTVFPHAIQQLQVNLHTELILPQEILQLQGSSHVILCRSLQGIFQQLFPVFPSILHGRIRLLAPLQAFQGHTAQAGFQLILPSRNSTPSGSQHPRSPYSSSQAESNPLSTTGIHLVLQNSTRRNRIHFKRVKYCISMQY